MTGEHLGLALSVFLACAVEAVEALTIVLAMGVTRGWRSALAGVGAAALALVALVAALGPALLALPIDLLRLAVGALLLIFGLQWLRKAILRAAGLKALHDETEAFEREARAARAATTTGGVKGLDGYAFTVSFKGVLLEGLEVIFIVLTFGANQHRVGLAAASAALAVGVVTILGIASRRPLARVPENAMKLGVGVMLTAFGTLWAAEGAGASWPAGDGALLALIPATLLAALATASILRRRHAEATPGQTVSGHSAPGSAHGESASAAAAPEAVPRAALLRAFVRAAPIRACIRVALGLRDFVVGDDWRAAVGVVLALALTAAVAAVNVAAWWLMPLAVLALLARLLLSPAD